MYYLEQRRRERVLVRVVPADVERKCERRSSDERRGGYVLLQGELLVRFPNVHAGGIDAHSQLRKN